MKKYLFLVCIFMNTAYIFAQDRFGLKLAPSLVYHNVHTNPDTTGFAADGMSLGFKIGPIYDFCIQENYYINTGLFFVTKKAAIKNQQHNIKEAHSLQYLQVPALLKLYTSELTLDTRMYFEVGPILAVKINERVSKLQGPTSFIEHFKIGEISGLFGLGVEYDLSLFTSVFAGISYQLGLTSILKQQHTFPPAPQVLVYSNFLSLDIGIKF